MSSLANIKILDVDSPPTDSPSSISFSSHDLFAVTAWDSTLSFYNYNYPPYALKSNFQHTAPLLSSTFVKDTCIAGSVDGTILSVDLNTGSASTLKIHESGVRHLKTMSEYVYISGSWDKTVKFIDIRQQTPIHTLNCQERVYGMDYKSNTLALLLAGNKLQTFDTNTMTEKQHNSKLSWSIKCLCLVDDGLVVGGIEGRGEYLSTTSVAKRYSFRCHRTSSEAYAINDIITHPKNESVFMTCGSDGSVILYDKSVRQKLFGESFKVPVCCGAFSGDGSIFAAGLGYDWSRGYEVTGDKPAIKVVQMNTTGAKI